MMAVNKTAGVTKVKSASTSKKATGLKKASPTKSKPAPASKKAKPALASKKISVKKAAPQKVAGPKLTDPQQNMLKKVIAHKGSEGYHPAKIEHKVLESLLKHKLVKKGKKHPETKQFHYQVSTIGKKHFEMSAKS
jgi:hypothetical protein